MDHNEFKKLLAQDLEAIGQRHQKNHNDGLRFTHWVLESVFLLSDSEAHSSNFDGPGDGGLDAFSIDLNDNLVRLIQCKYSENIERDARESFITLPHKLRDPQKVAETNPSIYDCSLRFVECIKANFGVHMTFVFLGDNRAEYTDDLSALIKRTLPPEERDRYTIEVIGIDELMTRYLARNPYGLKVPTKKILTFNSDSFVQYQADSLNGLVVNVSGKDLAQFGDKPEMFLANFRYFLDLRNKVNSKISETIQDTDERPSVWAYNNGVTIVCDRFDPPDLNNKTIQIYRPQIVNGCQTVSTLNRPVVHRFSSQTTFLVRIIATTDDELKSRIATYTNSQTKVSERALRSNDPIQKDLQHQFSHCEPPYFYDCKEGEWDALTPDQRRRYHIGNRNYRRISNIEAAKAYLAFNAKPIEAKSGPKLIWDLSSQGLYTIVFPSDRRVEELLLPFLLSQHFTGRTEAVISQLGETPRGDDALIKEYLGHADTTLLALAGYTITKAYNDGLTVENLKSSITRVSVFAEALFDRCNAAVKYEVFRAKNDADSRNELFSPRNYFLRVEAFKNARNKIDADIDLLGGEEFYRRCGLRV